MIIKYTDQVVVESVDDLLSKHPTAKIMEVDGKWYVGDCDACGKMLFDCDAFWEGCGGRTICQDCAKRFLAQ